MQTLRKKTSPLKCEYMRDVVVGGKRENIFISISSSGSLKLFYATRHDNAADTYISKIIKLIQFLLYSLYTCLCIFFIYLFRTFTRLMSKKRFIHYFFYYIEFSLHRQV